VCYPRHRGFSALPILRSKAFRWRKRKFTKGLLRSQDPIKGTSYALIGLVSQSIQIEQMTQLSSAY